MSAPRHKKSSKSATGSKKTADDKQNGSTITPPAGKARKKHPSHLDSSSEESESDPEESDEEEARMQEEERSQTLSTKRSRHHTEDYSDGQQRASKRRDHCHDETHLLSRNHVNSSPQSTVALNKTISDLKKKLAEAEGRIREMERALQVARYTTKTKRSRSKQHDSTTRQYRSELRAYIKYNLGRKLKFLPKNFEYWSENERSVCQMVLSEITFHSGVTDEDKMSVWTNVLAPSMTALYTDYKNKIHQPMRITYMSK